MGRSSNCRYPTYYPDVAAWLTCADGPAGIARVPVGVVTHVEPEDAPEGGMYTFVTDGIESALEQVKVTAGNKDVAVMGGAEIEQQYIRGGLVDETSIHLAPVLFGGTRKFGYLGEEHIQRVTVGVIETPETTHLRYRVVE